MGLPSNPGRYRATIQSAALARSQFEPYSPEFQAVLLLTEEWCLDASGKKKEWRPCQYEMRAYYPLFFQDRTTGEISAWTSKITGLMESLGWDGKTWKTLADTEWAGTKIAVTVERSAKGKLYVKWINAAERGGTALKGDAATLLDEEFPLPGPGAPLGEKRTGEAVPPVAAEPQGSAADVPADEAADGIPF
jgi:hypothetical protein